MIRKAGLADKEEIIKLAKKFYNKSAPEEVKKWGKNYEKRYNLTLVAEINKKIIAYIAFEIEKNALYIGDVYVLPNYRKKGVGTALIKKTEKIRRLINKKYLRVDAREKDKTALKFYKKMRFKFWKNKGKNSVKLIR